MAQKNMKVLGGLFAVALFILLAFYIPRFFEQGIPEVCFDGGTCQHETYLEDIISYLPAMIVLGFVLGVLASYFYLERKIEIPIPRKDKTAAVLGLLHPLERKIIQKIIDSGGSAFQSDISRMEGIGKVRAHRIIDKLLRRGVLEKEEKGKTNILKLKKEIMDAIK
jgi:hypothetical protein